MGGLDVLGSMATREVVDEIATAYRERAGVAVNVQSIAGVEAARRIAAGERFDVVVLADAALASLEAAGHVVPGSRVPIAQSGVAVAVKSGAPVPDLSSESALKSVIVAAPSIGFSTGPSGNHLLALFDRWGLREQLEPKLVQASPGVPVGGLVASGKAALGFQQMSELVHLPGITVAGFLPPAVQRMTVFSGAACTNADDTKAARDWLAFASSPGMAEVKRRHGMEPANP